MREYDGRVRDVTPVRRFAAAILAALRGRRLAPAPVPVLVSQRRRGQAVVEFVLVIGVFLLLIFGLVCVGQILLANYTVNQAARAAAHQAAINGGDVNAAKAAAESAIRAGVGTDPADATVTVVCQKPGANPSDTSQNVSVCRRYYPVSVKIVYQGAFWVEMPPLFTAFSVQAQATRAAERDQQ